jgi:hypothetical protein
MDLGRDTGSRVIRVKAIPPPGVSSVLYGVIRAIVLRVKADLG